MRESNAGISDSPTICQDTELVIYFSPQTKGFMCAYILPQAIISTTTKSQGEKWSFLKTFINSQTLRSKPEPCMC